MGLRRSSAAVCGPEEHFEKLGGDQLQELCYTIALDSRTPIHVNLDNQLHAWFLGTLQTLLPSEQKSALMSCSFIKKTRKGLDNNTASDCGSRFIEHLLISTLLYGILKHNIAAHTLQTISSRALHRAAVNGNATGFP